MIPHLLCPWMSLWDTKSTNPGILLASDGSMSTILAWAFWLVTKARYFSSGKKSYNNNVYLAPISIKRMLTNSKLNSLFDSTHFHTEGCHLCRWLPLWLVWRQTDELGAVPGGLAPSDPREPPHTPGYFWWVPSGRWRWHFCGKMAPCSEWLPGAGGMEILHHIFTLLQLLTMH